MKKSYVLALGLSCFAVFAYHEAMAQVGLGGGVVGSLGANGSASRFGGIGSGISTGATLRGDELRQTGQLSTETRAPATNANASGSADTNATVKPSGVSTGANASGGASASAPIVSGSAWGSAEANAQAATPDVKDTVRDTKAAARNTADKAEQKRDKLEDRGDKAVDKALQ